jgi:hypothetical protein
MVGAHALAADGGNLRRQAVRRCFGALAKTDANDGFCPVQRGTVRLEGPLPLVRLLALIDEKRSARRCGALILIEPASGSEDLRYAVAALRACIRPQDPVAAEPAGRLLAWLEGVNRSALPRRLERLRQALLARGVPLRRVGAVAVDAAESRVTEELPAAAGTAADPLV